MIRKIIPRFVSFLAAGLPGFLLALPLNYALVERLSLPKWGSYAIVLVFQVTINYVTLLQFVFDRDRSRSVLRQYFVFLSGILGFRLFDWMLYVALTATLPVHYLVIQAFNILVFSVAKFLFATRAIEGKTTNNA